MRRTEFLENLGRIFTFTETMLDDNNLYVFETEKTDVNNVIHKFTIMKNTVPLKLYFHAINKPNNLVTHICIDGDIIPFRQEKYNPNSLLHSDGRPDFMLFDDLNLLFVELKVEQLESSFDKDKTKWKLFSKAMHQIVDFIEFLKIELNIIGKTLFDIYPNDLIKGIICMRFEPDLSPLKRNTQRNNERLKLSNQIGFEIIAQKHIDLN